MRRDVLLLLFVLAACGPTISAINERPQKFYQQKISFTGRVERMQFLPHDTLLEVADRRGGRILVRSTEAVEAEVGDWVEVEGVLVPEARVEDVLLYDVVAAEHIGKTRAPRFLELM